MEWQFWKAACPFPDISSSIMSVKEQRNILHEVSKRKVNRIGYILRRICLLRRFIEGKMKGGIEVTGRRGRRRKKLLDDLKERRGYSHLKEEALDRTKWRTRFGRGFGPVVRQSTKWMNECQRPFISFNTSETFILHPTSEIYGGLNRWIIVVVAKSRF